MCSVNIWLLLYNRLAALQKKGVKTFYVPGNHDAIVFYLECAALNDANRPSWSTILAEWCRTYGQVLSDIRGSSFRAVCEIHYPFLKQNIDGHVFLLLMVISLNHFGQTLGQTLGTNVKCFLTTVSRDCKLRVAQIGEIASRRVSEDRPHPPGHSFREDGARCQLLYSCARTNRIAGHSFSQRWAISRITVFGCGRSRRQLQARIESFDDLKDFDCLEKGRKLIEQWEAQFPVDNLINDVGVALDNTEAQNYTIIGMSLFLYTPFNAFHGFHHLIYGHFHKPRKSNAAVDTGGMVSIDNKNIVTYLTIDSKGAFNLHFE